MTARFRSIGPARKVDALSAEEQVLDLLIVIPETRRAWEGRQNVEWEGGTLSVVSPEGLITLKSFGEIIVEDLL